MTPSGGEVTTDSGIPVARVYGPGDVGDPEALSARLGQPGTAPYTRGPYPEMYRQQLWTMRQYAGFGTAEETNERFRFLLGQGQTALSVAFDLPTQMGFDSDDARVIGEVGRVGVAIDTADDMCALFEGLRLDQLSVNFTINATAPIILAFYIVAAELQGASLTALTGTLQNDILKEFLARNTYIHPPRASMRLSADVVEYCSRSLPRFNPISVTGYHAREAGCDAVDELGFTMSSAIAYSEELLRRGLAFDSFAPRLSFHFSTTMDLFEEVAKLRAARRLWYRIATERFGAMDPNSGRLRFFSGCSGASLSAAEPLNNIIRSTIQCLGAVLGGAQSIHVMGYDEPFEIPHEEAVTLALRTQQIVAYESGVTRTVDPLAGSYFVEALTDELERRAAAVVARIDAEGGMVSALEQGFPQARITESAYRYEREITSGERTKVGLNRFVQGAGVERWQGEAVQVDDRAQAARVQRARDTRNAGAVTAALDELRRVLESGGNVMPVLIDAARARCTVGELSAAMRTVLGEFRDTAS